MAAPRISLVTLGVADMDRALAFYEAWGWKRVDREGGLVMFQANGTLIALFGLADLAEDQARPGATLGTGAMTLAQNYATEAEVDEVFAEALAAGATELKRPQAVFWGGYSGYVADPDGHVWELAMNPFWPLDPDGTVALGG
ncbi:VOC family protein [Demequina subtropica]|uniref:VOC family protein n=1 Tax=Demequina subtropica TaxID=1638989 RepID=UPI000783F001|nr:VOC family protein [Demequina subtropica]